MLEDELHRSVRAPSRQNFATLRAKIRALLQKPNHGDTDKIGKATERKLQAITYGLDSARILFPHNIIRGLSARYVGYFVAKIHF